MDTSGVVAGFAAAESVDTAGTVAGFAARESVDTATGEMAGFAVRSPGEGRATHSDPRRFEVGADRTPADADGLLNAPERPSERAQRHDFAAVCPAARRCPSPRRDHSPVVGVNVSTATRNGRFSGVH